LVGLLAVDCGDYGAFEKVLDLGETTHVAQVHEEIVGGTGDPQPAAWQVRLGHVVQVHADLDGEIVRQDCVAGLGVLEDEADEEGGVLEELCGGGDQVLLGGDGDEAVGFEAADGVLEGVEHVADVGPVVAEGGDVLEG